MLTADGGESHDVHHGGGGLQAGATAELVPLDHGLLRHSATQDRYPIFTLLLSALSSHLDAPGMTTQSNPLFLVVTVPPFAPSVPYPQQEVA